MCCTVYIFTPSLRCSGRFKLISKCWILCPMRGRSRKLWWLGTVSWLCNSLAIATGILITIITITIITISRSAFIIISTIFETTIPILMAVGLLVRFPIYLLTEVGRWTWPWVCLQSKRSIAVCTRRIPLGTDAGVGQVHHHHLHHHHQHQHRHLQQNLLIKIIWSRTPYMADSIRNWWRALNKCIINTNIIIVSITIQGTKSWLKIILLKRQTLIAIVLVTTNSF